MARPKRRTDEDHELPALPPLDGDDGDDGGDHPIEIEESDEPASLDDDPAAEHEFDELDPGDDERPAGDDAEGPADPGDDADEIESDDGSQWSGDDREEPATPDGDEEPLDEPLPDDRGAEGPENERDDADLDALPPLDDDADGDRTLDDDDAQVPEGSTLPAFALPLRGGSARVLRGSDPSVGVTLGTALGASLGLRRLLVAGDSLAAIAVAALDDGDAVLEAVEAPPADEVFTAVVEDDVGALTLGALSGAIWRRARASVPWRLVAALSEGRSTGAVALALEGRRVWATTALGTLHRSDDGARFEAALASEGVRALAVDPHGGVLAALSGRRRDALRASRDGRIWTTLLLPEELSAGVVASAGDVCVVAHGGGTEGGFVSNTGGASWRRWELLAGATAVAVLETDDGDARLVVAAHHETEDRAAIFTARVGPDGDAVGAASLADLDGALPASDDDDGNRVDRIVPLDRAGHRLALVTARGLVVIVGPRP